MKAREETLAEEFLGEIAFATKSHWFVVFAGLCRRPIWSRKSPKSSGDRLWLPWRGTVLGRPAIGRCMGKGVEDGVKGRDHE